MRSLKRYVAMALGDDWEIRLGREEGAFERPFARVWQVAGSTYPLTGGSWLSDVVQPFVISAYPWSRRPPMRLCWPLRRSRTALYQCVPRRRR